MRRWNTFGGSCSRLNLEDECPSGFEIVRCEKLAPMEREELRRRRLLTRDENGGDDLVGKTRVVAQYARVPENPDREAQVRATWPV